MFRLWTGENQFRKRRAEYIATTGRFRSHRDIMIFCPPCPRVLYNNIIIIHANRVLCFLEKSLFVVRVLRPPTRKTCDLFSDVCVLTDDRFVFRYLKMTHTIATSACDNALARSVTSYPSRNLVKRAKKNK